MSAEARTAYLSTPPSQVPCGRCDCHQAGEGAKTVVDPKRGLIVACSVCLPKIERDVARARAREREKAR